MHRSTLDERVAVDALAARIIERHQQIDSLTHRLLIDIRAFDEVEGWKHEGMQSCAHWLSARLGIGLGTAREKVRVARALGKLPALDEALETGQVSYSQVRAVTRVATEDNEETLVNMARQASAAELEYNCRLFRRVQRSSGEEPVEPPPPERWLRRTNTDDGLVRIEIQLEPEQAARVIEACRASAADPVDGLVAMAEMALRGNAPERPPVEVMAHVDVATLDGHTEDGTRISAETCERLLCDAGIVPVLDDATGKTLEVGRKLRTPSPAVNRALRIRSKNRCEFPGCPNRRYGESHHIEHWIRGGETVVDNLVRLCTFHHTAVHEGGVRVERDGDRFVFYDRHGRRITRAGAGP